MSESGPWTILRVLTWTAERFAQQGLASPRLDAELLLAHALRSERIRLYMEYDKPLGPEELTRVRALVRRRLAREPVAYLTGVREFWSLPVRVDRRVLIPRPETELAVELARDLSRGHSAPRIVDVGTGSGAILAALGRELSAAALLGIDLSADALAVARENLAALGVKAELLEGDLLEPLPAGIEPEVIVANPPYVSSAALAALDPEVRDFEPRRALDGGPDGLDVVRRLVPQAAARLARGGWLVMEIGHDQATAVRDLLAESGFDAVSVHKDLAGRDRVAVARRPRPVD